ncbi:MAG: hypothetical protein ABI903_16710 [Actinomycetota bacterium]
MTAKSKALTGGPITLRDQDGYRIWAELSTEGALVISGQDLNPPNGWEEYEYVFTIPSEGLPLLRSALDGTKDETLLDLVAAHSGQFMDGELGKWLDAVGAHHEFWSRMEPGHD